MLLLGYILVTCYKNNIVTLHVTFVLYRRNKTCLLGMVLWLPKFGLYVPSLERQQAP